MIKIFLAKCRLCEVIKKKKIAANFVLSDTRARAYTKKKIANEEMRWGLARWELFECIDSKRPNIGVRDFTSYVLLQFFSAVSNRYHNEVSHKNLNYLYIYIYIYKARFNILALHCIDLELWSWVSCSHSGSYGIISKFKFIEHPGVRINMIVYFNWLMYLNNMSLHHY